MTERSDGRSDGEINYSDMRHSHVNNGCTGTFSEASSICITFNTFYINYFHKNKIQTSNVITVYN